MKVEGLINDEEEKEVRRFIKELLKDKKVERIGSGFLYVSEGDSHDDILEFDVLRQIACVRITKKEAEKMKRLKGEVEE